MTLPIPSTVEDLTADWSSGALDCDVAEATAMAWDRHRPHAVYSWLSAATTAGMGSKWQPVSVGMNATIRTTSACAHLDSIGLIESRLA